MGKHLDEARGFEAFKKEIERKKKVLEKRGWSISWTACISYEAYGAFLDTLLESEEVVKTDEIQIRPSDEFKVENGVINVDVKAPLAEIIAYIKE